MAKAKIIKIELLEEIPTRKPGITQEQRLDGCLIDFNSDGNGARECYESIVSFLQSENVELSEIDDAGDDDED